MRFLFKLINGLVILLLIGLSLYLLNERKIFDIRTLVHIDPVPKTEKLVAEKKYADAHEYLSFFMDYDYVKENPKAKEIFEEINEVRASYKYKKDKFFEGLEKGRSDEEIGKITAIISDFLVIGDVRDLTIEGKKYSDGEKVDKTIVALSSLGILASASTLYTLGATAPIKSSISILKFGKRAGKIPSWLNKIIIEEAKIATKTKSLKNIKEVLTPIHELYKKVGLNSALNLIKRTKSLAELKDIAKLSKRFGKKSGVLIQNVGLKSVKPIKEMEKVKERNILYASTYGSGGIVALKRLGQSKFMTRVMLGANAIKTGYKGNLDFIITKLLRIIPTKVLFGIVFLGLFYFIYKFYLVGRKVFKINRDS